MAVHFEAGKPIFLQIEEIIRNDIVAGRYKPGEKLPGVRDLALWANVNPNTMQKALTSLEEQGLIETRGTNGKFICEDPDVIVLAKEKIIKELADSILEKCKSLGVEPFEVSKILTKTENTERNEDI